MQIVVIVVVVGACNEPKVKFNSLIMGQHMGQAERGKGRGRRLFGVDFAVFCCAPSRPRKYAMQLMWPAVCPGCPLSSAALPAQTMASSRFLPISSSFSSPSLSLRCLPLKRHAQCTLHNILRLDLPTRHTPHSCHNCHMPQHSRSQEEFSVNRNFCALMISHSPRHRLLLLAQLSN